MYRLVGYLTGTALTAATAAVLLGTAPAHADDAGYLQYLNTHGYTAHYADGQPISSSSAAILGHMICENLHVGRGVERQAPNYPMWPQFPLMAEAAEHEICPNG